MASTTASNGSSVTTGAFLIAALSFASRLLGLLRDRMLAGQFGAGAVLDAYYAAFRIPDFLFNLIGLAALSAAFLPVFIRLRSANRHRAMTFAARILTDVGIVLLVLCAFGALFATPLMRLLVPGFPPAQFALAVELSRVLFFATFLLGCSTVVGAILQSEQRFFAFAFAPLCYNLGIILGIRCLEPAIGPIGLAWGVVMGAGGHFLIQVIAAARAGFRIAWQPSWRDSDVRVTFGTLLPRMFGLAVQQVQFVVIASFASALASGTLAAFSFATNIQTVPIALIGISYAVAVFPSLSDAAAQQDHERFRSTLSATIRQILLLAFPAVVILLALKAQIVRVLLGTGAFDWDDTVRTLDTLEAFGFGLIFALLTPTLTRAFYARGDTWTPFGVGLFADVIGIGAAWVLGPQYGARGFAIAISIAAGVQAALLFIALRVRSGPLDGRRIARASAKFASAAVAMGLVIQYTVKPITAAWSGTDTFVGITLQGALAGGIGFVVYFVAGFLLQSEEITALAHALRRRVLRLAKFPTGGGADEARG